MRMMSEGEIIKEMGTLFVRNREGSDKNGSLSGNEKRSGENRINSLWREYQGHTHRMVDIPGREEIRKAYINDSL